MTHSQENVTDLPERVKTCEQIARDLLEEMEIEGAQSFSSGEIIGVANWIARALAAEQERDEASNSRDLLVETVDALQADLAALREKLRDAERELAIAGVRGSPPPWGDTTIGTLNTRITALRAEQDYLAVCLGEANASKDAAHEENAALREQVRVLTPLARAALKERDSWFATFTSQLRVDEMGRNHLSPDTPDTAAARRIVEGT